MRTFFTALAALALASCGQQQAGAAANGAESADETMAATADTGPPANLLTLAEGAVVLSASVDPARALSLTDGADGSTWSNGGPRFPGPYTFVMELRAPTRLAQVGVEGAGARPAGAVGASAQNVRVEASSEGPEDGYALIGIVTAAADGETLIPAALDGDVRWLRFTIESNHGNQDWTYLDGVAAYGTQTPPDTQFAGIYEVGPRAFVELKQDGASLSGCYVEQSGHANGAISGDVVDGVARLAWRRTDGPDVSGVALLVRDSRGHINGVRYRDRSRTVWSGPPAAEGATTPCSEAAPSNPIADALAEDGEARIYGILFDFNEATIKPESEAALRQLLAALNANAGMNVTIEGHTDSVGEDAYNLALSERRAQSVVAWLTQNGVEAARMSAAGRGEAVPVANNDTADGRALNRRVEVRRR
ncbi:MAG: OmpA family protein [Hyphomonadaceae bacterium]